MKLNNKNLIALIMLGASKCVIASEIMTVAEYEAKAEEIYNSKMELTEKTKQIQALEALWDARESFLKKVMASKMANKKEIEDQSPAKVAEKKRTQSKILKEQLQTTNEYIEENMGWDLNTIFLTELMVINNDAQARIVANGEDKPIDVNREISLKREHAGHIITGFEDDGLYIKNLKSKKTKFIVITSANAIIEKIQFNQKLAQDYANRKAIGELEAKFQKETAMAPPTVPLPASYPTILEKNMGK